MNIQKNSERKYDEKSLKSVNINLFLLLVFKSHFNSNFLIIISIQCHYYII